jgi:sarcosine oxidase subunit beta
MSVNLFQRAQNYIPENLDFLDRPRTPSRRYKVAIIGADLPGLLTAYFLATKHGITDVAIFAADIPQSVSSRRNAPISRLCAATPELAAMAAESLAIWSQLPASLEADLGLRNKGHLILARQNYDMGECRWRCSLADFYGGNSRIYDQAEIGALFPGMNLRLNGPLAPKGGAYESDSYEVAPGQVWHALAGRLNRLGAHFFIGDMPQHLVLGNDGISGVERNNLVVDCGAVIATDTEFAVAAAAGLGVPLKIVRAMARVSISNPMRPALGVSVSTLDDHISCWQGADGEFVVSDTGSISENGSDAPTEAAGFLMSFVPVLGALKLRRWIHQDQSMGADGLPLLGEVGHSGFFINCGWGASALTMAPIAGEVIADQITKKQNAFQSDRFKPERFELQSQEQNADVDEEAKSASHLSQDVRT